MVGVAGCWFGHFTQKSNLPSYYSGDGVAQSDWRSNDSRFKPRQERKQNQVRVFFESKMLSRIGTAKGKKNNLKKKRDSNLLSSRPRDTMSIDLSHSTTPHPVLIRSSYNNTEQRTYMSTGYRWSVSLVYDSALWLRRALSRAVIMACLYNYIYCI